MLEPVTGYRLPVTSHGGLRSVALSSRGRTVAELVIEIAAIVSDRREAREIISLLLGCTPGWISAHGDSVASDELCAAARASARRRASGAPLAYAIGKAAFRHLVLNVDERVLIPRPETEIVVEETLRLAPDGGIAIDVGTGSGAIALSLATEARFDRVIATDVSLDALDVAGSNVVLNRDRLRCPIELRHGSLLDPARDVQARLIVANPPYIAAQEMLALPAQVRDWEPAVALLGGRDGMQPTLRLIAEAAHVLELHGWLVLESDTTRAREIGARLQENAAFSDVAIRPDLTGRDRVIIARRCA